jgi:hypothetical protein
VLGSVEPQRYAIDESGRRVAFVRELATRDGYRICLFPDGDQNRATEGRIAFPPARWPRVDEKVIPAQEAFAIKMATRWLATRVNPVRQPG